MWAEFLIAAGLAILLGVGVTVFVQRGGGRAERRRSRAIAEASGARHEPLAEGEQEHAEEMRALAEEHRTGEQRIVRKQQHLTSVAAIARRYARKPKHAKAKLPKSKRFDPLTSPLSGPLEKPVMLPSAQPKAWALREFTEEWNAADVEQMVAKAKAGTR